MIKNLFLQFIPIANAQTRSAIEEGSGGIQEFITTIINKAPFWIAGIVVIIFAFIIAKILKGVVSDRVAGRLDEDHQDIVILIGRTTYVLVLTVGIMIGMGIAGMDLTPIIAAVGFGLGFALQGIITNFIAGVLILLARHFTIGDYIEVDGTIGKIIEVQARATILQSLDGTRVVVPNADLFSKKVTSFTSNPFRRIEIIVGVEYSTQLEKAVQICMATMLQTNGVVQEPKPNVLIDEFSDSSINLKLWFWVDSRSSWRNIRSSVSQNLKINFDKVGINIPFPIRTVYQPDPIADAKKSEKLMNANFGEFINIGQNLKMKPIPVKTTGEEKSGSEFLERS